MLMPSIFGENMFDEFFRDPFFDSRDMKKLEKKLYGRRGKNLMKTDIRESDTGYELEMDLPGFRKDEIRASLRDGYLTISAAKGLDKDEQELRTLTDSTVYKLSRITDDAFEKLDLIPEF